MNTHRESMAPPSNSLWMLVMGACFALAVGADCGRDCALCVYRLLGQQDALTSLRCSVECEGALDTPKLRSCRDVLLEEGRVAPDNAKQEEAGGGVATGGGVAHQLAKKYGGFMKRYGGFMIRRSPGATGGVAAEGGGAPGGGGASRGEEEQEEEEEFIRLAILKILNAEAEGAGPNAAGEAAKRYGGFMRRGGGGDSGQGEGLLEDGGEEGRGLKKRYGGFMRRVGRPEWLEEAKASGGVLKKRAWEEGGGDAVLGEIQKRYGGFMD